MGYGYHDIMQMSNSTQNLFSFIVTRKLTDRYWILLMQCYKVINISQSPNFYRVILKLLHSMAFSKLSNFLWTIWMGLTTLTTQLAEQLCFLLISCVVCVTCNCDHFSGPWAWCGFMPFFVYIIVYMGHVFSSFPLTIIIPILHCTPT
jgi:hypothetical protein